jgi:type IV fimbrial biogenesis protein FimT
MVGLVILAILLSTGLPAFSLWIQNTQTRTGAESILNGLQLARAEAVTRNANVRFNLTSAGGEVDWSVGCVNVISDTDLDGIDNCPAVIQSHSGAEGSRNARIGISTATPAPYNTAIASGTGLPSGVTFTFLGRVANPGADITRIDVTNSATTDARRMVIVINAGGTIRMCDPDLVLANNPQGCA